MSTSCYYRSLIELFLQGNVVVHRVIFDSFHFSGMEQIEIKSFWEKGNERGGHEDMYR